MTNHVGLGEHLKHAYYLPNLFVHNSVAEIMFSLQVEADGTISPTDAINENERNMADVALEQSYLFLLKVMELEIEHYGWNDSKAAVQRCVDEFGEYLTSARN